MLHWHNSFQDVPHSQKTFKYIKTDIYIYLLWAIFEGTLVIVYQKNAQLRYKTTCSESESRNFDCQWTLVSFLVKHNQFYREARLTCPLYRLTEDICIGICVFKRIFNVWHILKKKVCPCNNILNNFWGNKEELNWSLLEILWLRQCWLKVQISFHRKSCVGHSTAWNIFSKPCRPSDLWQNLNKTANARKYQFVYIQHNKITEGKPWYVSVSPTWICTSVRTSNTCILSSECVISCVSQDGL